MADRSTEELENILLQTHPQDLKQTLEDEKDAFLSGNREFDNYMKQKFAEKGITKREAFILADIPERYGYKLFSNQKHTRQRDVIYRICYAAKFTFEETQKAFNLYGIPPLYAKNRRDAVLIVALNTGSGDIFEANQMLSENGEEFLYTFSAEDEQT